MMTILIILGLVAGGLLCLLAIIFGGAFFSVSREERRLDEERKTLDGPLKDLFKLLANIKKWKRNDPSNPADRWLVLREGKMAVDATDGEILLDWSSSCGSKKSIVLSKAEQRVVKKMAEGVLVRLKRIEQQKDREELVKRARDGAT